MNDSDKCDRIKAELMAVIDAFREAHGLDCVICVCSFHNEADNITYSVNHASGNHYLREALAHKYADALEDGRRLPEDNIQGF